MKKLTNKKGFTLIEMLVVIAIIAILVAIIIPTVTSATAKANAATDAANLRSAKAAITIKVLDGSWDTFANGKDNAAIAEALGIPTTAKSNSDWGFTVSVSATATGSTGREVTVKYGEKTINDFAVDAGGTAGSTETSPSPSTQP